MTATRCAVPPVGHGSSEWQDSRRTILEVFEGQRDRAAAIDAGVQPPFADSARRLHGLAEGVPYPPEWTRDPEARADEYLWQHADEAELRALGYCRRCGRETRLEQVGRCVYTTCGHYRAQGDVRRMQRYLDELRGKIGAERRTALLTLIDRAAPESAPKGRAPNVPELSLAPENDESPRERAREGVQ